MGDPEGEWLTECDVEPEVFRGEAKGLLDIIYAVQNDRHVNIPLGADNHEGKRRTNRSRQGFMNCRINIVNVWRTE